jgi:hypothetical protein
MADSVHFHTRLPVHEAGFLEIKIDVKDFAAISDEDRKFLLTWFDKLTAFTFWCVPPETAKKTEVPAVLRGVVGGRQ